uniref:7TM_GPCR_Srx domain-containing protein n=1 Tax=Steinernema glaseri TaxID=37863 RepID=A0A1I7Y902_9BILA
MWSGLRYVLVHDLGFDLFIVMWSGVTVGYRWKAGDSSGLGLCLAPFSVSVYFCKDKSPRQQTDRRQVLFFCFSVSVYFCTVLVVNPRTSLLDSRQTDSRSSGHARSPLQPFFSS